MPAKPRQIRSALVLVAAALALATAGDPTADELAARRAKVAALDPAKQQDLLRKLERFEALPEAEQQRLRKLQAAIDADPNAERLLVVLERYHEWLKTITNSQRAMLAELGPKERVAAIAEIRRKQRDAQRLETLTWQDMRDIRRWVDDLVARQRPELEASIPGRYRDWYNRQTDPNAKHMALVYRLFGRSQDPDDESRVTQEDLDRLTRKLSESARAELAKAPNLDEQRQLVRGWIFASLRRSSSWSEGRRNNAVVGEELLQFLQTEVPPAERERLLQKPREEMLHELRKMYFERSGGPPRGSFDGRTDRHRPDHHRGRPEGPRPEGPRREGRGDDKPAPEKPAPADSKADPAETPAPGVEPGPSAAPGPGAEPAPAE